MKEITLENIADGVAKELFAKELSNLAANVGDQNFPAKTKRRITLTFDFSPDEMREEMKVVVTAKTSFPPIKPYGKTVHLGKRNGRFTIFGQDARQVDMFDESVTPMKKEKEAARA